MHQSTFKLIDWKRRRRRKFLIWTLYGASIAFLLCTIYQQVILVRHCGRDFRLGHFWDSWLEEMLIDSIQIIVAIAGLVGIWTKRGSVYFVVVSFVICTVMTQEFIDLLMGVIYMLGYGTGLGGGERFLRKNYKNAISGQMFAIAKIDRIQSCKKCCGIHSPYDLQVKYPDGTLIASCCSSDTKYPCTVDKAYKQGCAALIHQDESQVIMFHILSAISILMQIYLYRGFLSIFV